MSADSVYEAAAIAISAGLSVVYQAIRDQHPQLDWSGHDRRLKIRQGATAAQLGPDPALAQYSRVAPHLIPPLPVTACRSCHAPVLWGRTASGRLCPFDVDDAGQPTGSHFDSCPHARQWSRPASGPERTHDDTDRP